VSIVVYAGASGLVLPPTPGDRKADILARARAPAGRRLDQRRRRHRARVRHGAREASSKGGINRVILATDGDFNVGVTSQGELVRLIEQQRESGVFLTVLGSARAT
jgi:Ca-activated chloride channel homolog